MPATREGTAWYLGLLRACCPQISVAFPSPRLVPPMGSGSLSPHCWGLGLFHPSHLLPVSQFSPFPVPPSPKHAWVLLTHPETKEDTTLLPPISPPSPNLVPSLFPPKRGYLRELLTTLAALLHYNNGSFVLSLQLPRKCSCQGHCQLPGHISLHLLTSQQHLPLTICLHGRSAIIRKWCVQH